MLAGTINKFYARARAEGLLKAIGWFFKRVYDRCTERYLGISTDQSVPLREFGITDTSCHTYSPSSYRDFRKAMQYVHLVPDKDVFLDFGSGMGRIVIMAATYPFCKVIGVEISPELNAIASENVRRARGKLTCRNVDFVACDAAGYDLPPEVTVIFFYNPFSGHVLHSIMENIRRSLSEAPRDLTIIYCNPDPVEEELDKHNWLVRRAEFRGDYRHLILRSCQGITERPQT